ncbi:DUF4258 domain-containing protein [Cypionkella sinensis]|uniref:DUF4258 domain-containing protein n=1 Tax=Cypionkella sinensis TaxID=1756043 RepID=A0ABV7IWK8_9RHOB
MPNEMVGGQQTGGNNPQKAGNLRRPEAFTRVVRFLAQESSQVIITTHAEERMYERGITTKMLFDTLRKGVLVGNVEEAKKAGDYQGKIAAQMPNRRHVGVVTVVKQGEKLIIVTVEWEDGR